jgi:anaerobic ribonucleoside-triphosphate reductase
MSGQRGDRNGRIFEFPKCDFHISDETFKDPEQYALFMQACQLASRNGSTYFIFDRDEVTLSACCRLRTTINDTRMLTHPESMRFCGFQNVTINIPQAAYRAVRMQDRAISSRTSTTRSIVPWSWRLMRTFRNKRRRQK